MKARHDRKQKGSPENPFRFSEILKEGERIETLADPYLFGSDRRQNGEIMIKIDREKPL